MKTLLAEYIDASNTFDKTMEKLNFLRNSIELEAMDTTLVDSTAGPDVETLANGQQTKDSFSELRNMQIATSPGGFFSVDKNGWITYFNREAKEFLSAVGPEALSGISMLECFRQQEILHNNFIQAFSEKKPLIFEIFIYVKRKWMQVNICPHRGGLAVFLQDISDRKQHEAELSSADERFQVIFDRSPTMIAIRTLDEWKYVDVNTAWLNCVGYQRTEVIGRTAEGLSLVVDRKQNELLKYSGCRELRDGRIRTKTGDIHDLLIATEVIEFQGMLCSLFIGLDITELNKYGREIMRLERLNIVGEMAAGIAHEVRNPLTTIRGYLQLFSRKKDFVQYEEQLTIMIEEIDRADTIINDFLSLTKNQDIQLSRGNLNNVINALFPLLEATIIGRDHKLSLVLGQLPDILYNEGNIRQLILNLVHNGLDAMTKSGLIIIETYRKGNQVILAVQDTGPGLPQEILEKLGTPFMTTKDKGTGLGLAICFRIAKSHKAQIAVDTGKSGTSFYITFTTPNFV